MNLEARLRSALKALDDLLAQNDEMYRRSDTERLRGKSEGVKLALSYLNDEQEDQKVRQAQARKYAYVYCSCCDGKLDITGSCTSADGCEDCDSQCGDWPAPCNCDDPRTHNGH